MASTNPITFERRPGYGRPVAKKPTPSDEQTAQPPRPKNSYSVGVLELDDVKPRNESQLPNVLTFTTTSSLTERFQRFVTGTRCPGWAKDHVVRLRPDLSINRRYHSLQRAKAAERRLVDRLLRQGYIVNRRTPHRRVYVIELDHSHLPSPGKGFLYVGETSHRPTDRFQQHLSGAVSKSGRRLSSRWVERYGTQLRPDLAPQGFFLTLEESEAAEANCRIELEQQGYIVKGAHTARQK